jgi:hypothetical protein
MRYRKLRIAWSVVWGLAAVLLCVLWVRSYWWLDELRAKPLKRQLTASSLSGKLVFEGGSAPSNFWSSLRTWELTNEVVNERTFLWPVDWTPDYRRLNISFYHFKDTRTSIPTSAIPIWFLIVPHYYLVALALLIAGIAWLPWSKRFSIRTLLIATTLVAVVLGLVGYAVR